MYVAILHVHRPIGNEQTPTFILHGYLAVDLFFVLSGFVMALTYAEMFRQGFSGIAYRAFLIKRIARLYPLYLLLTFTTATLILLKGVTGFYGSNFLLVFVVNLLMMQAWGLAMPIVLASWSISTEWAAYLLFPFIVRNVLYSRTAFAVAAGLICVTALVAISVMDSPLVLGSQDTREGPLALYWFDSIGPIVRCLSGFVLGVLAYRVRQTGKMESIVGSTTVTTTLAATAIGLLCVQDTDIAVVLIFPVLIIALSCQHNIVARILSSKAVYMLGVWSYSIYLLHHPFVAFQYQLGGLLHSISIPGAAAISTIATLAAVVTLSYYCHKGIESPGRKLFQRLLKRQTNEATAQDRHDTPRQNQPL